MELHDPLLAPQFDFFGTPVYYPWKLFEWWFVFDAYAPHMFNTGGMPACLQVWQHSTRNLKLFS